MISLKNNKDLLQCKDWGTTPIFKFKLSWNPQKEKTTILKIYGDDNTESELLNSIDEQDPEILKLLGLKQNCKIEYDAEIFTIKKPKGYAWSDKASDLYGEYKVIVTYDGEEEHCFICIEANTEEDATLLMDDTVEDHLKKVKVHKSVLENNSYQYDLVKSYNKNIPKAKIVPCPIDKKKK